MSQKPVLTLQTNDFPQWYQEVIAKAEMAENGPARGTMIIKPWGYAIWESIQNELDQRIKDTGHSNVYFPLLIPNSFLQKEAKHVEGFSPEVAVVTHGGGNKLGEPLVVRPTSETVIGDAMSRWIQSHRDLPLLLNQWANVVRWEMRPRLFLRTSEFLWQEGHTAHATKEEAVEETLRMHNVYDDLMRKVLAIPTVLGQKTERERFPGADATFTLEGMMRDTKALQMGTSHYLGTNFSEAFQIDFATPENERRLCHTTSWGVSTRVIGGLIMTHGDDYGLRLPPAVAPVQAVVLAIRPETVPESAALTEELKAAGIRAQLDSDTHTPFGRRAVQWELKGVPVRFELGPRDLKQGVVTFVRRDQKHEGQEKQTIPLAGAGQAVVEILPQIHTALYEQALARREANTHNVKEIGEIEGRGFFRAPWSAIGSAGETKLAEKAYSVRCLVHPEGQVPVELTPENDLIAYIAKAY